MLSRDTVVGKDSEENEKICDTLDVMGYLSYEEELAIVLKRLTNNKAPGANSVVFIEALVLSLLIANYLVIRYFLD